MTPYITADRVAATIREVLLRSEALTWEKAITALVAEFAIGFFPDAPSAQRAFIKQCMPDDDSTIRVPSISDALAEYEADPPATCGFCRGSGFITNPDDLERVPCYCQPVPQTLEETEPLECCYLYPSPNCPLGDLRNPCTVEAQWGIHERGAGFDIISYACDRHLVDCLGHEGEGQGSFEFEVWPLKVALPELDPDKELAEVLDRLIEEEPYAPFDNFEPTGEFREFPRERPYTPDDDEEVGYIYDPDKNIGPPYDGLYTPDDDDDVNFYDPDADADCYDEDRLDKTTPANDPPDYDRQLEELMRQKGCYPVTVRDTMPDADTPEGLYQVGGVLYRVVKTLGLLCSFPVDEEGNALEPDEDDPYQHGAAEQEPDPPTIRDYEPPAFPGKIIPLAVYGAADAAMREKAPDDFCCEKHRVLLLAERALQASLDAIRMLRSQS